MILQVNAIKAFIIPGGLKKNIHKIFGRDIILSYNYNGVKGKNTFKLYKNINLALFGIQRSFKIKIYI